MGKNKSLNASRIEDKLDKLIDIINNNEEKAMSRHKEVTKRLDYVESEVKACQKKDNEMNKEILRLRTSINKLEQANVDKFINIRGVPEKELLPHELKDAVLALLQFLSITMNSQVVVSVERLGKPREGQSRTICVGLSSKTYKDEILKACKEKPLNCSLITTEQGVWGSSEEKIYVGQHLTRLNSVLFFEARKLRKKGVVKYAWIKDGQVLIKKSDSSKPIYINSLDDMSSFHNKHKVLTSTKNDLEKSGTEIESCEESESGEEATAKYTGEEFKISKARVTGDDTKKRPATSPPEQQQLQQQQRPRRNIHHK